ncbi:hypothetical protein Bca101_015316 [Brassica carinata]
MVAGEFHHRLDEIPLEQERTRSIMIPSSQKKGNINTFVAKEIITPFEAEPFLYPSVILNVERSLMRRH